MTAAPVSPHSVVAAVATALDQTPAYHQLDPQTRAEIAGSLAKVSGYVGGAPPATALADERTAAQQQPGTGATGRVGELTRATLGAIDFPAFVAALIEGTFRAIVDASIEQMEAYAELLKEVAKTVDQYMEDNVSSGTAQDYLADRYGDVFKRDATLGQPKLTVDRSKSSEQLPSFFQSLGFDEVGDLDDDAVQEVVVPAARKTIAEQRHQSLATMVLLGLNRIVVNDGEITAKLQFHIDASEEMEVRFDQSQTTVGNLAGAARGSSFTGQGIMVNTASVNAQSDINIRTDLTGQVTVRFSSDVMPLERFADSAAIQLINQHATVPQPPSALPGAAGGDGGAAEAQAVRRTAPDAGNGGDPWAPGAP